MFISCMFFFFSSRRRHTRYWRDWSSDVCSSDLLAVTLVLHADPRFDRVAARWTARLSLECSTVSLADAQLAAAALRQIAGGRRDAGVAALAALLERLHLPECVRELKAWRARQT